VELLKRQAGVSTLVITYKGAGPMLTDLMAGQVHLVADPMLSSLPLAQNKSIKALAITSLARVPAAPDIPTVAESGMNPLEFSSWYGLWGPKNMPPDLVAKIQEATAKVLADPQVKERLSTLGFQARPLPAGEFAKFIDQEMATYSKIIADANIKME
jgi:tripartite-type tricarboxylate transporter receptor subunit TctC